MNMFLHLKRAWGAIRWKMLTIFVFFSIVSMILVGCFSVAILNVVIRRESAYLLEEQYLYPRRACGRKAVLRSVLVQVKQLSLLPRREAFSGSGQTHPKTVRRLEVQNAKGEILTANDLELVTVTN